MAVMADILTIADLSVDFEGEPALNNLSFTVQKGDGLAVIGPNGAGKTVLLRALLGMIPDYRGTIEWAEGVHIGYVPQKIDADRHLPVNIHNLLSAKASILHLSKNEIDTTIKTVGLDAKILETPVGHLSGGQFQRALIAFALLGKPSVLILDEPTASIDATGEEQIYELVHRLQDKYEITTILVSHDLSFVYRYASKVLCLNKAGICYGTPEEALTPEVLQHLYGGPTKHHHHHNEHHDH
jgi:zinc transport system ATP-binding protein